MRVAVEICVDSVQSAVAAQAGGAQRVELCDNLMEGGTTPSFGSIEVARKLLDIKLHIIIRPRGGDFLYSDTEFKIMKRDIEAAKGLGVDGVVIGLLDREGNIDVTRTAELVERSRPMTVTFHRAFDVCVDPFKAIDQLAEIGVDRILTSGQEVTAVEGLDMLAECVKYAAGRISIMACGNLNERNIAKVIGTTGVSEVHFTAFGEVASEMRYRNERVFMGGTLRPPEYARAVTDAEVVRKTIAAS
ncbi:MAG TPA: copper homeostasis protein CutC [Pyrinomonadaceae bacterium]|nr:copper homeostasis protein CutC [Acidobacteriota bacterium]HQZ96021.1 copper homeostasis protein CutC [Pyrinomonadaceae bacterium]